MKKLSNLKGAQVLTKDVLQSINGGSACNTECFCIVCKTTVSGCVVCWDHHK